MNYVCISGCVTDDMWDEAHMSQVCHYVRAGKDLKIPEEFRDYIPRKL